MLVTQEYLKNLLLNHQYIFRQVADLGQCYKYLLKAKHRIHVYTPVVLSMILSPYVTIDLKLPSQNVVREKSTKGQIFTTFTKIIQIT